MLTTIKGIYDHGKITLTEPAPVDTKSDVIITFLIDEKSIHKKGGSIILGMLEGQITLPDDFDEPLNDLREYMQ
jgi:hypothetical protein